MNDSNTREVGRVFIPRWFYDPRSECWTAQVWVKSSWVKSPCWAASFAFRFTARRGARRMARKLNEREARGEVA